MATVVNGATDKNSWKYCTNCTLRYGGDSGGSSSLAIPIIVPVILVLCFLIATLIYIMRTYHKSFAEAARILFCCQMQSCLYLGEQIRKLSCICECCSRSRDDRKERNDDEKSDDEEIEEGQREVSRNGAPIIIDEEIAIESGLRLHNPQLKGVKDSQMSSRELAQVHENSKQTETEEDLMEPNPQDRV